MRLISILISLVLPTAVLARANLVSCWASNGQETLNQTVCPNSRACCGPEATCLSNGLCHDPNLPSNVHIRGPCEDMRFESKECPRICLACKANLRNQFFFLTNTTTAELDRFPRVNVCNDGSLCCEYDTQCCEGGRGVFLDNQGQFAERAPATTYSWGPSRTEAGFTFTKPPVEKPTSASTTDALTTDDPTTSGPPTRVPTAEFSQATSSPSKTSSPGEASNGDGDGLKIGLGVGISVGCLLIAGVAVWLVWRRRKASKQAGGSNVVNNETVYAKDYEQKWGPSPAYWQYPPMELEGNRGRHFVEMQG